MIVNISAIKKERIFITPKCLLPLKFDLKPSNSSLSYKKIEVFLTHIDSRYFDRKRKKIIDHYELPRKNNARE